MDKPALCRRILITSCFVLISGCNTEKPAENTPPAPVTTSAPSAPSLRQQRQSAEKQVRPDVEQERENAQNEAAKSLDQDAIAAIGDTTKALQEIAANKTKDALDDIEIATGKINILLARNPATAFIPVGFAVEVIDTAPHDQTQLKHLVAAAILAVDSKNLPAGRLLLRGLMSEIRVSTTNLPLASYPEALTDAAKDLHQGNTTGASDTLLTALNTLVVVQQAIPLPIILARTAVAQAEQKSKTDKAAAQILLEVARNELNRGKELGYNLGAPEYASLDHEIASLEKQVKAGSNTTSLFARLHAELTDFIHRHKK